MFLEELAMFWEGWATPLLLEGVCLGEREREGERGGERGSEKVTSLPALPALVPDGTLVEASQPWFETIGLLSPAAIWTIRLQARNLSNDGSRSVNLRPEISQLKARDQLKDRGRRI